MADQYVRIGADPEVFVKSTTTKQIVAICGIVGGTKNNPRPIEGLVVRAQEEGGYAYQEDGVTFEFNMPAATGVDHFVSNLRTAWLSSLDVLKKFNLEPVVRPGYTFKARDLLHPDANRIGCSPDMCAYGGEDGRPKTRTPLEIEQFGMSRFAGGHLHLGYDKKVPPSVMVRFIDVLLGLPSLLWDKQEQRRRYYGLAGLYREKPYGVEYRTLSNYWLKGLMKGDYQTCIGGTLLDLGITAKNRPEVLANAYKMLPWDDVKDAIEQENTDLAKEIFNYATQVAKVPCRYAGELWRIQPGKGE